MVWLKEQGYIAPGQRVVNIGAQQLFLLEEEMNKDLRNAIIAAAMFCLGPSAVMAQAPGQSNVPVSYECAAHCNVSCLVDGEKVFQTGSPKTVTVTLLAPNNYLVELEEQNGHVQFAYLAGAKVVCSLEGVTKKGGA
jgi:hypothetical protein